MRQSIYPASRVTHRLTGLRPAIEEMRMDDNWPKHPDGTPKKIGEMTPEERKQQTEIACKRLKRELESPEFVKAVRDLKL
jgi:hypothetical protein